MFELRPEHLNMPAWEVSAASKKDMFLHEPKAPWPQLGGGGGWQCKRKGSKGHHQWCCDITGRGMGGRCPRARGSVFVCSFAAV